MAANFTLVLTGTLGANAYDGHLAFDTPFLYDPADGNLLLEFFTPSTFGMGVRSNSASTTSGSAFDSAVIGAAETPGFARNIQYNFVDPAGVPELNAAHCIPAFTFMGLLCLAGRRRRQD